MITKREPREFWISLDDEGRNDLVWQTPKADPNLIHVREVMPDEPKCEECDYANHVVEEFKTKLSAALEREKKLIEVLFEIASFHDVINPLKNRSASEKLLFKKILLARKTITEYQKPK